MQARLETLPNYQLFFHLDFTLYYSQVFLVSLSTFSSVIIVWHRAKWNKYFLYQLSNIICVYLIKGYSLHFSFYHNSKNFLSVKSTFDTFSLAFKMPASVSSPNECSPIAIFLNSIKLQVNVPVLSLNIYSIYPSSSFKLELYTVAKVPVSMLFILASFDIIIPCASFTVSSVTIKEIGTKLLLILFILIIVTWKVKPRNRLSQIASQQSLLPLFPDKPAFHLIF